MVEYILLAKKTDNGTEWESVVDNARNGNQIVFDLHWVYKYVHRFEDGEGECGLDKGLKASQS